MLDLQLILVILFTPVGADTRNPIPRYRWVNLVFAFENLTLPDDQLSHESFISSSARAANAIRYECYRISLYVDGEEEISLKFSDIVTSNQESLHVFKDPSYRSPYGFASQLEIWSVAISKAQAKELFHSGRQHRSLPVNLALALMNDISNRPGDSFVSSKLAAYFTSDAPRVDQAGDPMDNEILHRYQRQLSDSCPSYRSQLELYAEASTHGSLEALYSWAMLLYYGYTSPSSPCGIPSTDTGRSQVTVHDLEQAFFAFAYAADMGYAQALMPLSMILLSSVGLPAKVRASASIHLDIPYPRATKLDGTNIPMNSSLVNALLSLLDSSSSHREGWMNRITALQEIYEFDSTDRRSQHEAGSLVSSVIDIERQTIAMGRGQSVVPALAVGLMHLASVLGVEDANAALAYRYRSRNVGVALDYEASAYYAMKSADYASFVFHQKGGQPLAESDRLTDKSESTVSLQLTVSLPDDSLLDRYQ
jgi:TPR repeat protein